MVDNDTRLDSVAVSPAMMFNYYYTLPQLASEQINVEILNQEMQESLEENIRSNPDLKYFRKHSVVMRYHYFDNHQKPITIIEITPAMYADE